MMNQMLKDKFIDDLPKSKGAVVVLSGGMDSTILLRLAIEKYGKENVKAISYFYNQKQSHELDLAKITTSNLCIDHKLIDISFLGDIASKVSSNVKGGMDMPTIEDILGDPAPTTQVPNRNAILLMIAVSFAQVNGCDLVLTGLQAQDQYSYFDTTPNFVSKMNSVLDEMRTDKVKILAPFINSNKAEEISLLAELDDSVDLLKNTLTCYNPSDDHKSCGVCPSCSERIANFMKVQIKDPIEYQIDIDWR
jgi:7-cyano-7-deazaguanine synthase